MALVHLDLNPDARTLRQFGFIALAAFSLLGGWILYTGKLLGFDLGTTATTIGGALSGLALVSGVLALAYPRALRGLYVGLMVVTFPIGLVVSHVILVALYYLVLTPVGLVMRVVGYDPMQRKLRPEATSYWHDRTPRTDVRTYFKQY